MNDVSNSDSCDSEYLSFDDTHKPHRHQLKQMTLDASHINLDQIIVKKW